jgi:hypothetical protein
MALETARLLAVDAASSQASVDFGQAVAFGNYAHEHAIVLAGGNPDFFIDRDAIVESREGAEGTLSWTPGSAAWVPRAISAGAWGRMCSSWTA